MCNVMPVKWCIHRYSFTKTHNSTFSFNYFCHFYFNKMHKKWGLFYFLHMPPLVHLATCGNMTQTILVIFFSYLPR